MLVHVLRNSLIPVVTVIALGIPTIFGGAIITEQIFRVNGLGQLLITGIQGADLPLVQTLTFIFAVLIVLFNLIADILYGILDPRIRYDVTRRPPPQPRSTRRSAASGATSGTSSATTRARWRAW